MKIGYPVTNLGLGCTTAHTFRLASLTQEKLFATIEQNLDCLMETLQWNVANNLLFYRIGSGIVPFASHPSMSINWQSKFAGRLQEIGVYIRENGFRISMHPGQYVVINSPNEETYRNSVAELVYQAELLDMLGLDQTAKIQFHLGGLHGDAVASTGIFVERYNQLPDSVRRRLVIENDERMASVADCVRIRQACGIPILFDTLHHEVKNEGETLLKGLDLAMQTWGPEDGIPLIDYSSQNPDKKTGAHAVTLDVDKFRGFVRSLRGRDVDIMLEIKNKEASALQAKIVLDHLYRRGLHV